MKIKLLFIVVFMLFISCQEPIRESGKPINISGIYPHLAYYNNEDSECGTGAVVPWAGKLWLITYGSHFPHGSGDKLYEITPDLEQIVREESIGGTPANRMIHKESKQLFIGPYAIDSKGNVRAISYQDMPGRHTGNARHLDDPAGKIYYGTMEEGFYEVDVNSLEPTMLYEDRNIAWKDRKDTSPDSPNEILPGAHGKGLYSGQGVMVYSNNGERTSEALRKFDVESGVLAEWDGEDWTVVRRNQFVEVTGPGGIYGNENPETDPIWSTGWDHKSVLLAVRDKGQWSFYRLPKASHSYDGAHGWNTEWPRIRDIGTAEHPNYLMTMHGMFWRFPGTFTTENTAGIRPRSAYLKVIGDFTRWKDQLVLGCDDSAQREFLNKRKAKGNIEGPGQSNSNLWFTSIDLPDQLGPNTAEGAVWLEEMVEANIPSEAMLFAGWPKRVAWLKNSGNKMVNFTFEVDQNGTGEWKILQSDELAGGSVKIVDFPAETPGEWIRVKTDNATQVTAHFSYTAMDNRMTQPDAMFAQLAFADESFALGGLLYGLGNDRRALGMKAINFEGDTKEDLGYYELDAGLNLVKKDDPETENFIRDKFAIPQDVVTVDESSVLVIDDDGRRWRLPLGSDSYSELTRKARLRICREVATERDLFSCHGTFYELPAENADGYAKIRPVSSHNFRIHDYASYRGMLIMTGINPERKENNPHIRWSEDGKTAVWVGAIDDLWRLGKPTGQGGPWKGTQVGAGEPSDPYLIGFYDKKELNISHTSNETVTFTIEVDPVGNGPWMKWKEVSVRSGEIYTYTFSDAFQSRWIRFTSNKRCEATSWLVYE